VALFRCGDEAGVIERFDEITIDDLLDGQLTVFTFS